MPEKKDVLYWLNAILERKYESDKVIICVDHAKTELKNIQQRILELEADNAKLRGHSKKYSASPTTPRRDISKSMN